MSILSNNDKFIIDISKESEHKLIHPRNVFNEVTKKMSWNEANAVVYKYFLEKYFVPKPPKKPDLVKQLKNLFPGKIYTYMYDPKYKDKLDYYDTRPIMLCIKTEFNTNTNNLLDFGINFNFVPLEVKNLMLNALWDTFKPKIEFNRKKMKKSEIMGQKPLFTEAYDYMELLDTIWEYLAKSAYRFALRNYIYKRMAFIKEIYYEDWGLIPFIMTKDVVGKELGHIFREYWAYKLQQDRQLKNGPKRQNNRKKLR